MKYQFVFDVNASGAKSKSFLVDKISLIDVLQYRKVEKVNGSEAKRSEDDERLRLFQELKLKEETCPKDKLDDLYDEYDRKRNEIKECPVDDVSKDIKWYNLQHIYEVITKGTVFYFDVEKDFEKSMSFKGQKEADKNVLKKSIETIRTVFPSGKLFITKSSRLNLLKKSFHSSFHFILRGNGYVYQGKCIEKILKDNKFPPMFDRSVYKRRDKVQYFRTIFSYKKNDETKTRFIPIDEEGEELKIGTKDIENYLAQNISGEEYSKYSDEKLDKENAWKQECKNEIQRKVYSNPLTLFKIERLLMNIPNTNEGVNRSEYYKVLLSLKFETSKEHLDEEKVKDLFVSWAKQSNKQGKEKGAEKRWEEASITDTFQLGSLICLAKKFNKDFSFNSNSLIDERLLQEDQGLGEIFLERMPTKTVFLVDDKGGFRYDEKKRLFIRSTNSQLAQEITGVLVPYIDANINNVRHCIYNPEVKEINDNDLIDKKEPQTVPCKFKLTRGKNKGNLCGKTSLPDLTMCKAHTEKCGREEIKKEEKGTELEFKTKNEDDEHFEGLIKNLKKSLSRVRSSVNCNHIFNKICSKLYNEEFINIADSIYPHLLPCNGDKCIDLRTGELIERRKEHCFTKEIPIKYDPLVPLDMANMFFGSYFEDKDTLRYIQELEGYGITGETNDKGLYVFYGPVANNGKSTYAKVKSDILGEFATVIDKSILFKNKHGRREGGTTTSHIENTRGRRNGSANEGECREVWNEEQIKSFTGQDKILTRALYKEQKGFFPTMKINVYINDFPKANLGDKGLKERMKVIPFFVKFSRTDVDEKNMLEEEKNLSEDEKSIVSKWKPANSNFVEDFMKHHLSSALNWLVKGSIQYYKNNRKLCPSKEVIVLSEKCFQDKDNDSVEQFITENLEKKEGTETLYEKVYIAYTTYYYQSHFTEEIQSKISLTKKLKKHGYILDDKNRHKRIWTNLLIPSKE